MDTHDKQITIAVPEDRVPEFYAFFARFLAAPEFGGRGRRGRGRGPGGHGHGGHGRCGHPHQESRMTEEPATAATPGAGPAETPAA